jgi:uncharacterized membrane protein
MSKKVKSSNKLFPLPYEWVFVIVAFIFGLMFIYQNPPFHSNDEDRHFLRAYSIAHHGFYPELSPDSSKVGGIMPNNLVNIVKRFQGFPYQNGEKMKRRMVEELEKVPLNKNDNSFHHVHSYRTSFWPYLPHALAIKLSGNANPVTLGYAGRIGGLIFYLICMFFIIRKTPVFKSVFVLFGIMPMTLYQASSVTYDTLLIVSAFAILSLYLRVVLSKDEKFGWKHLIYLFIFVFFMEASKSGYILLPFIMLFIPKHRFKDGVNPFLMYGLIFFVALFYFKNFGLLSSSTAAELKANLKSGKAFQRDFNYSQSLNVENRLADIPETIRLLWLNILHFRHDWLGGALGRFGYSYSAMPKIFYMVNGLALIAVASMAGKKDFILSNKLKYTIGVIGILNAILIIGGFFVRSPVGGEMVFGFQGRYFIPMVPFILLMFYNSKIETKYWDEWGSTILGVYCFLMLGYTYSQMSVLFYAF